MGVESLFFALDACAVNLMRSVVTVNGDGRQQWCRSCALCCCLWLHPRKAVVLVPIHLHHMKFLKVAEWPFLQWMRQHEKDSKTTSTYSGANYSLGCMKEGIY